MLSHHVYRQLYEGGKWIVAKASDSIRCEGGGLSMLAGKRTEALAQRRGRREGDSKIQIVAEQAADWPPDKAQTAFAAMLQAHPGIKIVYASNDMMAAGALLAAKVRSRRSR